jgi:hypothetical protein
MKGSHGFWHVACMEEMRSEFKVLVGKPEEKIVVEQNTILNRVVGYGLDLFHSD